MRLRLGETLRVAYIMNYSGRESEHCDSRFHIASLSLDGAKGSLKYEGRQALTHLIESDAMYILRYK